jgi:hypothetical protein
MASRRISTHLDASRRIAVHDMISSDQICQDLDPRAHPARRTKRNNARRAENDDRTGNVDGAIKAVGWNELLVRRRADDERLIHEYAQGAGRGRDLRPLRDWVRHVRADIGARGVITEVGLKPGGCEVFAMFYVEPEPCEQPATTAASVLDSGSLGYASRPSVVSDVPAHVDAVAAVAATSVQAST